MRLTRYVGRYTESFDDLEAFALLAANGYGERFHIFEGPEEQLKDLLVHGVTRWPMYIPYEEEKISVLQELLRNTPYLSSQDMRRASEFFDSVALLQGALSEGGSPVVIGEGEERVIISDTEQFSLFTVEGIETLLLFLAQGGTQWIVQNGFGSQKALLAFHAVEQFWGNETRDLFEDVVLGLDRALWHMMTDALQGVKPGEIVRIEPIDEREEDVEQEDT